MEVSSNRRTLPSLVQHLCICTQVWRKHVSDSLPSFTTCEVLCGRKKILENFCERILHSQKCKREGRALPCMIAIRPALAVQPLVSVVGFLLVLAYSESFCVDRPHEPT